MIKAVGIDIVENKRVAGLLAKYSDRFLKKFLSPKEINFWRKKGESVTSLCGIFAAKEAVVKAVSSIKGQKVSFTQIQINYRENGAPFVVLPGVKILISISHEEKFSVAVAVCDL